MQSGSNHSEFPKLQVDNSADAPDWPCQEDMAAIDETVLWPLDADPTSPFLQKEELRDAGPLRIVARNDNPIRAISRNTAPPRLTLIDFTSFQRIAETAEDLSLRLSRNWERLFLELDDARG